MNYILSLGSNIGDRIENLKRARSLLEKEQIKIIRSSSIYETQPVDNAFQPWFLNQVLEVSSEQNPDRLLGRIKKIEDIMERKRTVPKGPRNIDIDIILAGEIIQHTSSLTIPHPRMHKRNFVLIPLEEIAPQAVHPVLNKTVETLLRENADSSKIKKLKPD